MGEPPRRWSDFSVDRPRNIAVAICIAVAAARVVLAFVSPAPELVFDAAGYDTAARLWAEHGYFAYVTPGAPDHVPTANAYTLPGYPAFLAMLYSLPGYGNPPAQPLVSIAQALLSGLTLCGMYLIGLHIGTEKTGLLAVVLGAVYPPLWWSYRYVLTEDVFTLLSVWAAWSLLAAMDSYGRRGWIWAVLFGLLVATTLYVRAAIAPWVLSAGSLLVIWGKDRSRYLRFGAIVLATIVLCFAPWWARNATIYGRFVPLNTMTATGAFISTFDDWGDLSEPSRYWSTGPFTPAEELRENERLTELAAERNREQLRKNPEAWIWRHARATGIAVLTYNPNPFGGFRGWGAVTEIIHLLLIAGAVAGTWLYRHSLRVWVVAAYPLALIAAHAPSLIFSRYLFPMMPFVIVLAALAASSAHKSSGNAM